ncbi:MAG: flagellar hook-basal body complex protein [Candidatus Eremiobacteraeota bacterium]|nr:flagellar hook-basal body complex protein [Candidatus Eremiobacteraeota bacterium]
MNRALFVAASGMAAQQTQLDVVADNLANADVAGFKAAAADFVDVRAPGAEGLGVAWAGTHAVFEQGKLEKSGGPCDLAIDGPGFFEVARGKTTAYTRNGAFHRAADGSLQTADGWRVRGVRIPADAKGLGVDSDGRVWCERTEPGSRTECGRIAVTAFPAPEALRRLGNARFEATERAGRPMHVRSPIAFGMLERSNVSIVAAMMEILAAQRAYEANAKGVQAADEMQRIANNLHRS